MSAPQVAQRAPSPLPQRTQNRASAAFCVPQDAHGTLMAGVYAGRAAPRSAVPWPASRRYGLPQPRMLSMSAFFISCASDMIFEYISNIRLYFARSRW